MCGTAPHISEVLGGSTGEGKWHRYVVKGGLFQVQFLPYSCTLSDVFKTVIT